MERGFTLVEIAIVVVVLGLLLASLLGPLSVRIEQLEIRKTSDQMEEIKEALYGYAMANGALPCPDTTTPPDGSSEPPCPATPPACADGILPWQTLGVERADGWGSLFRSCVTPEFTTPDTDGTCTDPDGTLDLCDNGDIIVRTRGYNKPASAVDMVTKLPAIIVSHGKNGRGATPALGGPATPGPESTAVDELENLDGDRIFLTRHYTTDDPTCDDNDTSKSYCAFDDILVWISANVLKYRLVQA
ncbi:MAG: prepilin-type N-terminal cleavage/methylation domain-containing protein, partial [Pyrinomonadaceae bacterium]